MNPDVSTRLSEPPKALSTIPAAFDPRKAPVLPDDDATLRSVAVDQLMPQALRQRFRNPPAWMPERLGEPRWADREPVAAAVLVPLVLRESVSVLLTERSTQLAQHSGQVAFPGGKVDPGDADAVAAALREAHEEVGLLSRNIQVLGTLPIYTTGSAYAVTPVVALVKPGSGLHVNPGEVADTFEVPLSFLMNPAHHHRHRIEWEEEGNKRLREWISMPYWDAEVSRERFIWGATAGMLRNLYRFLSA